MNFTLIAFVFAASLPALASTYYVDSGGGSDTNPGTSITAPWKTLAKVDTTEFKPGDRVLLRAASVWHEQLAPRSSGSAAAPIVFDRYGEGPRPRLEGQGTIDDVVLLRNVQQIEVHNLQKSPITEPAPAVRRAAFISFSPDNFGTAQHIVVAGLYIHDVNGANEKKDNGGIIFQHQRPGHAQPLRRSSDCKTTSSGRSIARL